MCVCVEWGSGGEGRNGYIYNSVRVCNGYGGGGWPMERRQVRGQRGREPLGRAVELVGPVGCGRRGAGFAFAVHGEAPTQPANG